MIAGVDEAGRGALAGPVIAACVVLDKKYHIELIKDSKQLSDKKRAEAYGFIIRNCIEYQIGIIDNKEVDKKNILTSSLEAMKISISRLNTNVDKILIDGNRAPKIEKYKIEPIIKGDTKFKEISAASIIAKVIRDKIMLDYSKKYPEYNFEKNKGYGTVKHYEALRVHGPCSLHRLSFNLKK